MRYTTRSAGLIVSFVLCTLAGCFSLSRDTPPLEQYVLGGATVTEGAASSQDLAGLTIGVRRLDLAPYLATLAIVVRRGPHQIVLSEYHRWSEDPGAGITRAVAGYLAASEPIRAVDVAPWPLRSQYDYLIQLHVSRFEGLAPEEASATEGEVHMLATWEILRQRDEAVLARGATDYRERGWRVGDYRGLVTLLDRGLNALARELVTCLASVVSATPGTGADVEPLPSRGHAIACAPRSE
jgi:uncharacterized lipoprotein YmbA